MEWILTPDGVLVVTRTADEVVRLRRSVKANGRSGGFQNLQRYHVAHLAGLVCVITDPVWIERTVRYCTRYGTGGYQRNTGGRGRYGVTR